MEEYKERFIKEYKELSDRHEKLDNMIKKYEDGTLDFTPDCPIELLKLQAFYMKMYKNVLEQRCYYEKINLK